MMLPFFRHWYVIGLVPVTTTLSVALWPAFTDTLDGGVVITTGLRTVSVALLLDTAAEPILTVTM